MDNFQLKTFDQSIAKCNMENITDRIHVIEEDHRFKYIKISDIYANPYAIRKLISELPHVLARTTSKNYYPGYTSTMKELDTTELSSIVHTTIENIFPDFYTKNNIVKENISFITGIYTQKNITSEYFPNLIHTDSDAGLAGVLYLNYPEEYNGGTAFYKKNRELDIYEEVHRNKMEFNSLIIYESGLFHGIYFDTPDAFKNSYRITQRFFIGNSE